MTLPTTTMTILDGDSRSAGWSPVGWHSDLRLDRKPESVDDLIAFVRALRERLVPIKRLGRPDADDLSANAAALVADAWTLTRFVADRVEWSDVPVEPTPDSSYTDNSTGLPSGSAFRYTTAVNALWDLQQYLFRKKAAQPDSAIASSPAASVNALQASPEEGDALDRRYRLTPTEEDIVRVLGDDRLKGEEIAARTARPRHNFDGHFKGTLASLVKRGILINHDPGYTKSPAYRRFQASVRTGNGT